MTTANHNSQPGTLAKLGQCIVTKYSVRVDLAFDYEVSRFIATSPDVQGLVLESPTLEQVMDELEWHIQVLLDLKKNSPS
ncbi:DUF1902 domain-containing protein [Paraburkholderia fungorum]|jgi:hypothetical protein|uniref:DUF1902 domain-containing protein n=1 Tax=Paraburkholderia TaxID=1822464 RepID=UPI000D075EB7|nr:DUF1902 domain-containing protein [Paraburkholderia fungorum]PRZ45369.1 uncharacterized protein DUF1902 [Paraburkholderia fungorum]